VTASLSSSIDPPDRAEELWFTVRRQAAAAPVFRRRSRPADGRWPITIPPLGPGLYVLTARAARPSWARPLMSTAVFGLVEAEALLSVRARFPGVFSDASRPGACWWPGR
jgi:hypothetical protein